MRKKSKKRKKRKMEIKDDGKKMTVKSHMSGGILSCKILSNAIQEWKYKWLYIQIQSTAVQRTVSQK